MGNPYASPADIAAQYGAEALLLLTDRGGDGGADAGAAERALADAAAEIDGYLAGRYELPLEPGRAAALRRPAVDIAVYRLAADAATATDERRRRYEDARRYLERIASGEIRLGADALPAPPSAAALPAPRRRFSRRSMLGVS